MTGAAPLGVALVGAGMIAPLHVAALSALGDRVRLRWIVARRPERAAPLAAAYDGPAPELTADLGAVAADPGVHFAIVATPPSVRDGPIGTLAAAGKGVLLEKPVARSLAEAERVVETCERAGVPLGMLLQHRAGEPGRAAAAHMASGRLGRLGMVEIAAPLWRPQSYYDELGRGTYARDGGGVLLTQGIHTIDLALSLAGPVARVQAMTATTPLHRMEAEDFAAAGLRFACGAAGSLVATTASFPPAPESIALHFEHASLRVGRADLRVDWRDGCSAVEATVEGPKHAWHAAVIADFADALRTGRPPMVPGREALAAHRLIDAIERSSRAGHAVDLPG
ncbi:Gfo/Idh/MocA family protein [Jannaschia sp. W003]|uniref:Gfo/Idh/MocA family protein n=1 Tax=Jannaschia sp. W003 TaxID=2867012 RepID=UPI0021A77470|nr:Gfo/Idh/MocA family oxidoreductase [Jannaschia sp. W003]UWQ22446.1 Gfo/Idh/MocA family oxidoreductase [Jannaschia sp. W003]